MEPEGQQVYDQAAAAEIGKMREDPTHPLWEDHEGRRNLYARAYSPPEETPGTGKPASTEGPAEADPATAAETAHAPSDLATLAKAVELPEETVRETYRNFRRSPDLEPLLTELQGLEVPTPERESGLTDFYKAVVAEARGTIDPVKTDATLRKKWGKEYGANMAAANFAVSRLGLVRYLHQTQAFDHPAVIMRLAKLGARLLPVRSEYLKIRDDPNNAANNPGHPEHETARRELEQLRRKVYGGR